MGLCLVEYRRSLVDLFDWLFTVFLGVLLGLRYANRPAKDQSSWGDLGV
jgi:hypothetical protein